MTNIHRVSMGFAKFGNLKLKLFAGSVIVALTNNPAFPNLPVSVADLLAASDAFSKSINAAWNGGIVLTAAQNAARTSLIGLLRDEAHYIQIVAKTDLPLLLSSGFTATNRNSAQTQLVPPAIRKVLRERSEQLRLILKAVPSARSYQAQLKVGDGDWQADFDRSGAGDGLSNPGARYRWQHGLQRLEHGHILHGGMRKA